MTTNVLSIGSAAVSKKNIIGASAEISAEGTVTPQDANPSDTPFLPMFLQMLFVQSQIKPVKDVPTDLPGQATEASVEGTGAAVEVPTESAPTISILAGSIDGLTRLTMEKTQPAMDALKSQLAQTQRPRDGQDASMILPSLFGKNMRMPVANVHDIIQAISFNGNPQALGKPTELKANDQSAITLDAEGVKEQTARQLLASLTNSIDSISDLKPTPVEGVSESAAIENETIELDLKKTPAASTAPAAEIKRPSIESAASAVNAFKKEMDEAVSAAAKALSEIASVKSAVESEPSAEQPRVVAEYTPQVQQSKPSGERTVEKKGKSVRAFSEERTVTSEKQNVKEQEPVAPAAKSENETAKDGTSEDRRVVTERQPQQALKTEVKEYQRTAAEVEVGTVKAPSGLADVRRTEGVHTGAFKPETVRSMMEQLSKGVAVAVNENRSEMKIVLHPEALGEVTVRVQVEEGKVSAKMDVQQVQVKNTIEANMPQLREALTSRGLTMESIEISTAQNGLADGTTKQQQNRSGKRSQNGFELVEEEEDIVKMYGYNTVEYTV
ncbi:MAG: flagellar hook-length control protein FliK [Bacteroidota bacterium]